MSLGGKNVMLDCGMHMGFNDQVNLHHTSALAVHELYRGALHVHAQGMCSGLISFNKAPLGCKVTPGVAMEMSGIQTLS